MSTPGDESRTELAWREIVEHYGDRPVIDEDARPPVVESPDAERVPDDEPEADAEDDVPAAEQFRPPPPPPFPVPRTWQRKVAWAGIFLAPALLLIIGLFSIYVAPVVGWALVAWLVGGFGYLVYAMPRSPRDPWDDGSRV